MSWFRKWQAFARCETSEDPGPINNMTIAQQSDTLPIRNVRQGSDYAQINLKLWKFFFNIYGGGPEIVLRGASEFSKSEREAELVDTAENLSLNDDEMEEPMPLVEPPKPAEAETTSILKPVKTVSFEDGSDSEVEEVPQDEKVRNVTVERHHEPRKAKKTIKPIEVVREKRHHRATEHGNLFGAEGEH